MTPSPSLRLRFRGLSNRGTPLFDFLVPALAQRPENRRHVSTSPSPTSTQSAPPSSQKATPPKRRHPLSEEQRDFLDSALRVNQAGELAATLIYTAQTPPLLRAEPHLRSLMQHMHAQEAGHFRTFNALLARHRIRPTLMYPLWTAAATALGWGTAMLGREAAMACTEAVETEIGGHYNGQVRVLLAWMRQMEENGEEVGEEIRGLAGELKRIRDEELEHLDTAVGEDAREAKGWPVLNAVIRGGCRGAIWVSERI
ncbi:MAG: hypothetical protein LQ338_006329 [Usnochroma carphineum]|nr:MAG: hypothetical protein LQ338_006329 [Usnochroma carphineum]